MFKERRRFYSSPCVHRELAAFDRKIGRHRVAQLMQLAELKVRTNMVFVAWGESSGGTSGKLENLLE